MIIILIKKINNSNERSFFIDTYYDNKYDKNYILVGNKDYVKSYDYYHNKLYRKYCDESFHYHCSIIIDIPNNKITVNILKRIIYYRYGIKPSFQRLTYQIYNEIMIVLSNEFPLFYFHIKDFSTIYLENLENYKHRDINRSNVSMKYMNKLGYFSKET